MPFKEIYSVDFKNGNRQPHINPFGWPAMQFSTPTINDYAERFPDFLGWNLRITKGLSVARQTPSFNSIYVVPPRGIRLHARLRIRAVFDLPMAAGFPIDHGPFAEEVEHLISTGEYGVFTEENTTSFPFPSQPITFGLGSRFTIPEPWAVTLSFSSEKHLQHADRMTIVSCQFNRQYNGIRLNTPSDLQSDQPANLIEPLDYLSLQGMNVMISPANSLVDQGMGQEGDPIQNFPPPLFTFDHSFSGWEIQTLGHAAGVGFLRVKPSRQPYVEDHRAYSAPPFYEDGHTIINAPSIRAIGVSLAMGSGQGWASVRIRSFQLWYNASRDNDDDPAQDPGL